MVILSDIDGLYTANPQIDPAATLIPVVDRVAATSWLRPGARCPAWEAAA